MFWPALSLTVLLGGLFSGISLAALRHAETPPTGRALAKALAWLVVLLVFIWGMYGGAAALTGYLAGGSWQGHALSGSKQPAVLVQPPHRRRLERAVHGFHRLQNAADCG